MAARAPRCGQAEVDNDKGDLVKGPSESTHPDKSHDDGVNDTAEPTVVVGDAIPVPHGDLPSAETVMVEVLPGIAVVFGDDIPAALEQEIVDFGLLSPHDRSNVSAALAAVVGDTATVGGNLANASASVRGLYQVDAATQALLNNGGAFAVKDGANLGTVFANGKIVAQGRFIPASVTGAQTAAAIGPALAMIAIQMQLNQISSLVSTNIALTGQVLSTIRHEQWAELTGLVATIDRALKQAREIGSVPESLWGALPPVRGHGV